MQSIPPDYVPQKIVTSACALTDLDRYPSIEAAITAAVAHDGHSSQSAAARSRNAKAAADARHSKPNGSREKQAQIREIWASAKYSTRDLCAEEEYAALGISFSTARKALRGTPEPNR
jgi:hypothetical protein